MSGTLTLGPLLGVRVVISPAWLAISGLVVVTLFSVLRGPGVEQLPPAIVVGAALVVTALLLVSVVAHELAHAVVARRRGMAVSRISMILLGALSDTDEDPPGPLADGLIAVAGPVVSVAIGLVGLAVAMGLDGATGDAARGARWVAWWLAAGNLLLAGVNLVPGFPFDGGRLLRAIAWGVVGDQVRATRVASAVGRTLGYLVVFAGFVVVLEGAFVGGSWLVLIGWFLTRAAKGTYNRARLEQLLGGLHVSDALERDPLTVPPTLTVDTLLEQDQRLARGSGLYPVTVDGRLLGTADVADAIKVDRAVWPTTHVEDVMRGPDRMRTFALTDPLIEVVAAFEETGHEAFAVVPPDDPGSLIGLVTREKVHTLMRSRNARLQEARAR